jgi:ankyrin repeat protein
LVAAQFGNTECLKLLVTAGASVEATDSDGRTLDRSIFISDEVKSIIWSQKTRLWTPLMIAVHKGDEHEVDRLIQGRADVSEISRDSRSAIHVTSLAKPNIATKLIESRANVSLNSAFGTPLDIAISRQQTLAWWETISTESIELLKTAGADGWNPIMVLAEKGYEDQLSSALFYQKDQYPPNAQTKDGNTALHIVAEAKLDPQNFIAVTKILLESNADVNARNNKLQSPLDILTQGKLRKKKKKIEFLRQAGAGGWTPLMLAASKADDEAVLNMINDDADLFATNKVTLSIFSFACLLRV